MTRQKKESRMVNEYLLLTYPNNLQWTNARLGPLPDKELARMYMVTQRYADAIVAKDNDVVILEAKIKPDLGGVSQLEAYRDLFPQTPQFRDLAGMPIKLLYLCARDDKVLRAMCDDRGIEFVVYAPKWLEEPF